MSIGMEQQEFEDCELACCVCGKQSRLVITAHRSTKSNRVVGYLFVCNKDCFDQLQKIGLAILGNPNLQEK